MMAGPDEINVAMTAEIALPRKWSGRVGASGSRQPSGQSAITLLGVSSEQENVLYKTLQVVAAETDGLLYSSSWCTESAMQSLGRRPWCMGRVKHPTESPAMTTLACRVMPV